MIYTVYTGSQKQTYGGFRRVQPDSEVIAIVFEDGGPAIWELDSADVDLAVEELGRYYRAEGGRDVQIAVYNLRS